MNERTQIARATAEGLRAFSPNIDQTPVMLGFDGFVDSIIDVVDQRITADNYTPMPTIDTYGKRISAAAGKSANFELVVKLRKLGGNGPIMANAMSRSGFNVTYVGALGYPTMDPVFHELAERAEVHSISEPGFTDALEFEDGKLMIGKLQYLNAIDVQTLRNAISDDKFFDIVNRSVLIGMINWTMCAQIHKVWQYMLDEVYPKCEATVNGRKRMIFIDLTDPAKRPAEDLRDALCICSDLTKYTDLTLGLNLAEAIQVSEVLNLNVPGDPLDTVIERAAAIREAMNIAGVVVHPRQGAGAAILEDGQVKTAYFKGPFVANPKLSTGAGDNFNAGYCLGMLAGLTLEQRLCCGTGTSGFYVRNAKSPTLKDLSDFCNNLPEPEGA
ncbi:pfkB family carbohydrate kinase [Poriferisphaera corsica]|uniref:PfkB family carbohydrate kinase n=1 Tax=Poriferisphaera corsica TaxID=2528020 RepID=A0A517YR59_9BACT|nr:carbohydrate kinase family protein [Poriferisphaera corsica]QDU32716.1 pfkB family carbohydrate kinase [Poriferisphaera corsica]